MRNISKQDTKRISYTQKHGWVNCIREDLALREEEIKREGENDALLQVVV